MARWPHGWREQTLRASGVPITQYALDVLSAWRKSTPTEPWTNNPLGMPAHGSGTHAALGTPYAAFVTFADFTAAFKRFVKSQAGMNVLHQLISADSLSSAWREIHALKWPANVTESDYPVALLDMVEQKYRTKLQTSPNGKRRSAGTQLAPASDHEAIKQQGHALHSAAASFSDGKRAIRSIVRRLG